MEQPDAAQITFWFAETSRQARHIDQLDSAADHRPVVLLSKWVLDSVARNLRQNFGRYIPMPDNLRVNCVHLWQQQESQPATARETPCFPFLDAEAAVEVPVAGPPRRDLPPFPSPADPPQAPDLGNSEPPAPPGRVSGGEDSDGDLMWDDGGDGGGRRSPAPEASPAAVVVSPAAPRQEMDFVALFSRAVAEASAARLQPIARQG